MVKREIPLDELLDRCSRRERELRNLGAHTKADGIREAVILALRIADEEVPAQPIEPSET